MYGAFAPAGETPMTVQAIYGVPSPIHDTGGDWSNGNPQDVGTAGAPSLLGAGTAPAVSPQVLSSQRSSALIDPSHPTFWLLLMGVGLLALVHFDVGGSASVRAKR